MSLLDSGQVVALYPDVEGLDADGNRVRRPGTAAVEVVGRWQYVTASEDGSVGDRVGQVAEFLCRSFPAGFAGRVVFDDRDWDVDGDPRRSGLSSLTSHWSVRLRARGPRPVT